MLQPCALNVSSTILQLSRVLPIAHTQHQQKMKEAVGTLWILCLAAHGLHQARRSAAASRCESSLP